MSRSYPTVQAVEPNKLAGPVRLVIENFVQPNPLDRNHDKYDIGYEAAKRDLLWQLRDVLGPGSLPVKL